MQSLPCGGAPPALDDTLGHPVTRKTTSLSVNLNKVALVRNTRLLGIPSVLRAADLCLQAGANGVTVHPRPDQRHIRTSDVPALATLLQSWPGREFNIEGNPLHNLMDVVWPLVESHLPVHQLTFVPDTVGQLTSDHGFDFPEDAKSLDPLIAQAHAWGLQVSVFVDANARMMADVKACGADRVELYTQPYAASWGTPDQALQLERFAQAALAAQEAGLGVNAGHDLNRDNLTAFLAHVPGVREVSIGHALISDALEVGYAAAVQDYQRCIRSAA